MQRALRAIAAVHSLAQRAYQEQQVTGIAICIAQMSDLQQLAAAALHANSSSSSSCPSQWQGCGSVRHMGGRTHKLSLKRENNKASHLAVAPYLQQQEQQDSLQQSPAIATGIPALPVLEEPVQYTRIGRMTGPYSVGAQPCFAVMESGGCQWKVTADDVIYHNKIKGVEVNDVLTFNKVLLLGTRSETTIGRPYVPGASVVAAVEETFKDAKVYVFKKKVRKRYSKLMGHRSHITALRILEVRHPPAEAAALEAPNDAAAAISNVAAIGSNSSRPNAFQLGKGAQSSGAGAAAAAAAEQAQEQAGSRQRQRAAHRAGIRRAHGPPAVLDATTAQ